MSKSPHTPEFRAQVSQEYLDGYDSYNFLATKYNIGRTTLQEWLLSIKFMELKLLLSHKVTLPTQQNINSCVLRMFYREKEILIISLQSTTYLQDRYSDTGL